jgi:hypothetical protein
VILVVHQLIWTAAALGLNSLVLWSLMLAMLRDHAWSSLPESLLVMFLLVLPAESFARKRQSPTERFGIRALAWIGMGIAIAGTTRSQPTIPNLLAFLAGAGAGAGCLVAMELPGWRAAAIDGPVLDRGHLDAARGPQLLTVAAGVLGSLALAILVSPGHGRFTPTDHVIVVNRTGAQVYDLGLRVGGHFIQYGAVPANGEVPDDLRRVDGDSDYEIEWKSSSKEQHRVKFQGRFRGSWFSDLRFEVLPNDRVRVLDGDETLYETAG